MKNKFQNYLEKLTQQNNSILKWKSAAVAIAAIISILALILVVNTIKNLRDISPSDSQLRYDDNDGTSTEKSGAISETIEEALVREKSEDELSAMIKKICGVAPDYKIYEDYDGDGIRELFAYVEMGEEVYKDENRRVGQIWFVNVDGAELVFDTKTNSIYDYKGEQEYCGIYIVEDAKHFFMKSMNALDDASGKYIRKQPETIVFAYEDGKARKIYQGNADLVNEEGDMYEVVELYDGIHVFDVLYVGGEYCEYWENGKTDWTIGSGLLNGIIPKEDCVADNKTIPKEEQELVDIVVAYNARNSEKGVGNYKLVYKYDDYDGNGHGELFAFVHGEEVGGLYYCDEYGEVVIIEGESSWLWDSFDTIEIEGDEFVYYGGSIRLGTLDFGTQKACIFNNLGEDADKTYMYVVLEQGIKEISMASIAREYEWNSAVVQKPDGVYFRFMEEVYYDEEADTYYCAHTESWMPIVEEVKLQYVNGYFLECASHDISEDVFLQYDGGDYIIEHSKDFIIDFAQTAAARELVKNIDAEDYELESIRKCSDGKTYLNFVPRLNIEKYYIDSWYQDHPQQGVCTIVIEVENTNGNHVDWIDTRWGYRENQMLDINPWFSFE